MHEKVTELIAYTASSSWSLSESYLMSEQNKCKQAQQQALAFPVLRVSNMHIHRGRRRGGLWYVQRPAAQSPPQAPSQMSLLTAVGAFQQEMIGKSFSGKGNIAL